MAVRVSVPAVEVERHPRRHAAQSAFVTAVPFLALALVAWQLWGRGLYWQDLVVFAVMYVPIGFGVTVGYHRYFTHRAFKTGPVVRALIGALGSAALLGPVISWTATHRRHHALSDREGDPHSPHVGHDGGETSPLRGLFHAHLGWLFLHGQRGNREKYARDLLADKVTRFVDRTFLLWTIVGLVVPFGLGYALTGSLVGGLTGALWGGLVRIAVLHHMTFSINSLCHVFGRRQFRTRDESRNLGWLSVFSLGEAWHNNHHAFPTSAAHGLGAAQIDPSAAVVDTLERLGLAWDVVRISPERRLARAGA